MPSFVSTGCMLLSLAVSLAHFCGAQAAPPASPVFTVASIKPSDPNQAEDNATIGFNPAGSFDAKSQSLKELIEFAYDIGYYDVDQRMMGGPKWLDSARFDIVAKCDERTARAFEKMGVKDQVRVEQSMVQALLAERFKLKTHLEKRSLPVFALAVEKGGLKMKPSTDTGTDERGDFDGDLGNWTAHGETMNEFASDLATLPEMGGKIIVDKTGLNGKFDFTLKWTPDTTMGAEPANSDNDLKPNTSAPSLLTALREQLGLRLEWTKEPVDVIVIDSAELPSPN
jgi:uncharacterized protein (TIGR03435 family)